MFFGSLTKTIAPREAKERLCLNKDVVLLDVRTREEYAQAHIAHSVCVPLDELRFRVGTAVRTKDTEIIVYCHSGARAAAAVKELNAMGYTNVSSMGGIISWPYGTERG